MSVVAIIVAAGQGVRMDASRPKAFLRLRGRTLLERAIEPFLGHPAVGRVVAAVPDPVEAAGVLGPVAKDVLLVRGGETRQESVRRGLAALPRADGEIILVHDAARPLVTRAIIDAVIAAARRSGAAMPVIVPADTPKQIGPHGEVEATLPRERLRLAQTPQGFDGAALRDAHARAESDRFRGTDDAALIEWTGGEVALVEGSPRNFKITTPWDLELAEAILAREAERGEDA